MIAKLILPTLMIGVVAGRLIHLFGGSPVLVGVGVVAVPPVTLLYLGLFSKPETRLTGSRLRTHHERRAA